MSEEEIMQGINKTISFMKEELKADHSCFTIQELWAVNGLLDLYNKEKEKNKKLEDKCIELSTTIDALETDLTEEKEKNRELERYKKYYEIERVVWNRKDYISKDKIKELLKEIQEEKDKATKHILKKDYHLAENGAISQELGWVEGKIQSLLEENEWD